MQRFIRHAVNQLKCASVYVFVYVSGRSAQLSCERCKSCVHDVLRCFSFDDVLADRRPTCIDDTSLSYDHVISELATVWYGVLTFT